jgi:hypothetical protein
MQQAPAEPESIYAPPSPPREDEGINEGAVHLEVSVVYASDYVYRGLEISELPAFINPPSLPIPPGGPRAPGHEDALNLQISERLYWDTGKWPHPFVGVFVNAADSDPVQTFQVVQPTFGLDWTIRPFILTAGHNTYLYPDRDKDFATSEVFFKVALDDSYFLSTDQPFLSPYLYGAYDYDRYNGWYIETGVSHDFNFSDYGLIVTVDANVAYVRGVQLYQTVPNQNNVNGFQHYQLGMIANYSLNQLFKFPTRYGDWSIEAFVYYTDGIDNKLESTTQVWGGTGVIFKY